MDHNRKVVELPLDDILPNRFQPRIKFNEDSIIELSESIKEHGVIQPIVVRPVGDKYEIIAGERRYKASCMAGLEKIPALITDLNDKDSAEVALIENVQRKDLTPIEEAISYKKILDMGYLTQEKLAEKLGKKQSTVANKLRLLNLDEDVQEAILEDKISERHARSILKLQNPADQKKVLKKIIDERLTVRKTDEVINNMLNGTFEETKQPVTVEPIVKDEAPVEDNSTETPFDFSKLDFLQSTVTSTPNVEEQSPFEVPKFEDILAEEEKNSPAVEEPKFEVPSFDNFIVGSESEKKQEPIDTTPTFEVPKFEDMFIQSEETSSAIDKKDDLNISTTEATDTKEPSENLIEKPVPFVFDNLFINNEINEDTTEKPEYEQPETIEYIDDLEEATSVEPSIPTYNSESKESEISSQSSGNNMYVASDFKTVINTIRNCAATIEKYGFKINVEELELPNEYKVTFTVEK